MKVYKGNNLYLDIDGLPSGYKVYRRGGEYKRVYLGDQLVFGINDIEWRKEVYRTAVISMTVRYVNDSNLYIGDEEVRTTGRDGVRTYYREYEYVNGSKTNNWRNETSAVTTTMIERVIARGTKPREVTESFTVSNNILSNGYAYAIVFFEMYVPSRALTLLSIATRAQMGGQTITGEWYVQGAVRPKSGVQVPDIPSGSKITITYDSSKISGG